MKRLAFRARALAGIAIALLAAPVSGKADAFYWTNSFLHQIQSTDPLTDVVSVVGASAQSPYGLVFDPTGTEMIYTSYQGSDAGVWAMNTDGTGNHQLATSTQLGGSNNIRYLALDPGGNSVLVSTTDLGNLYRINLLTNAVTQVASLGAGLSGITYDNAGSLFATVSDSGTSTSTIYQLNPVTGAVINSESISNSGLLGLSFDPLTGNLFSAGGDQLVEISSNLSTDTTFTCSYDLCDFLDGTASDNAGNIFIADIGAPTKLVEFDVATQTFTAVPAFFPGITGLAPLVGLGSPSQGVPEPTESWILALAAGLLSWKLRKGLRSDSLHRAESQIARRRWLKLLAPG